ncbi:TetR/AcrR family transcriptional regulator [Hoeflea sp.]|uniref:TetR/AcrR family transcriptional regulator n=1 Tax=Hoeflea sp. TaxID=1940281 RepID=UPI003B0109E7
MPEKKRKFPHQKRAQKTIDEILEATAQLLERSGKSGFTTNHIARRAGYSIGTLYRYFPHKMAIMREMVESELRQQELAARALLERTDELGADELIRGVVRAILQRFGRSKARKSVLTALIHDAELVARTNETNLRIMHLFQTRLVEIDPDRFRPPTEISCLALSGALLGSIRSTLFSEPTYLKHPEYERELIAMVTHFVSLRD